MEQKSITILQVDSADFPVNFLPGPWEENSLGKGKWRQKSWFSHGQSVVTRVPGNGGGDQEFLEREA